MIKIFNDTKMDYFILAKLRVGLTPIYIQSEQMKYLEGKEFLILDFEKKKIEFVNERIEKQGRRVLKLKNFSYGKAFLLHVSPILAMFAKYIFIDLKNKTLEIFNDYIEMNRYVINRVLKDLLTSDALKIVEEKINNDEMVKMLFDRIASYVPETEKKNINIRLIYSKAILFLSKLFNISVKNIIKNFDISYPTAKKLNKKINIYI
ncbi:MAG: hypothetical protein QW038_02015 [Nanopusillaceae archaeon]